ncbi:MAG: fumarylacetoacetate hydrolase family protein [Gammaproteobacteria bacterium]|nr:fumarylacetoacetate hydrolase family protein [Gammaproteobacteria bacterium]
MQLVTIDSREVAGRPGVLLSDELILDLVAAPRTLSESQWLPQSVVSILAAGDDGRYHVAKMLEAARNPSAAADLTTSGALLPLASTELMAPVRRPGLMLVAMAASNSHEPEPPAFIKGPATAAGHGATVTIPWAHDHAVHASAMPVAVLGRPLYQGDAQAAEDAIAAWTVATDISMPEPAPPVDAGQWRSYLDSKQFPGAFPSGPALLTRDEIDGTEALTVELRINGVAGKPRSFSVSDAPALLAALSRRYGFRPGDMVAFGMAAAPIDDRRPLRHGDRITARFGERLTLDTEISFPRTEPKARR